MGENLRQAIIILGEQQQQLRAPAHNKPLKPAPDQLTWLQVMVRAVCDGIMALSLL